MENNKSGNNYIHMEIETWGIYTFNCENIFEVIPNVNLRLVVTLQPGK